MSSTLVIAFVVFFYAVIGIILLGWLIPLIMGIRRRRRQAGGAALIAVGSVWGTLAIALITLIGFGVSRLARQTQISTFDAASYKGETGTITMPWNGTFSLQFLNASTNGGNLAIPGKEGKAISPTGTFAISMISLSPTNLSSVFFFASAHFTTNHPQKISVTANGQSELRLGPPFTASIQVNQLSATNVQFIYELVDAQDNPWVISNFKNRGKTGFEVRNEAGKVVWKGDFNYG